MGYDRGGSFPFDFTPKEIPFGSKSVGKERVWLPRAAAHHGVEGLEEPRDIILRG